VFLRLDLIRSHCSFTPGQGPWFPVSGRNCPQPVKLVVGMRISHGMRVPARWQWHTHYEGNLTPAMTKPEEGPRAHIEVIPAAAEQEPAMANLLELYGHDFSEFHDLEIGADGRFGYPSLPLYWSEPDRYPFLVKVDGKLAGLVLVKRGSGVSGNRAVWDMAEFFVLRGCRRRGIGTQVAHEVWKQFPGPWEVRVMKSNVSAHDFWTRAISAFTGEPIHPVYVEKGGKRWKLYTFESEHR
jgi:predicted acetyltransferase